MDPYYLAFGYQGRFTIPSCFTILWQVYHLLLGINVDGDVGRPFMEGFEVGDNAAELFFGYGELFAAWHGDPDLADEFAGDSVYLVPMPLCLSRSASSMERLSRRASKLS